MGNYRPRKDLSGPTKIEHRNKRPARFPFRGMKKGQSVVIPTNNFSPREVGQYAHAVGRRQGKEFACRTVDEGVKVWCLKG